ncbi:MAG: alginate export family protein [Bacteroidia bacterium]|jgi:hypothetical protein|nr:alginate export family protein [Bacteroidia bacterium]
MNKTFAALLVAIALPGLAIAQTSFSGEFRPRAEYRHGFKTLMGDDDEAAFQISQRSRLNLDHKSDKFKAGINVQEVRLWGETPQLGAAASRIMLHQAWAEWMFADGFSIKAGRQELNYDDARILGNVEWAQQARAHDVALLKYEKDFKLHIGLAFNQTADLLTGTRYALPGSYKSMQFLWYNRKIDKLGLSVLFLNNGMEKLYQENGVDKYKTVFSQTAGARLTYNEKKLSLQGNFYYTGGKDVTERKLSAMNYLAAADYKLNNRLSGTLGFEHLSGTSMKEKAADPTGYINKSFNPFYGTNHKFNGLMDFFYVGNHLNSVGLNDMYFGLSGREGNTTLSLTAHMFSAAADVVKSGPGSQLMPASLGTELDFTLQYKINEQANLQAGYSHLFGTATLQNLRGGNYENTTNWAWLMLTYKPVFFRN